MPWARRVAALLLLAGLGLAGGAAAQPAAVTVDSFSPQGEVRRVQQMAIRFSQDMVALGQADAPAPVQVDCSPSPEVSRRWVDTRRWVAEFKQPLPVGTRCSVRLQPGLRSLAGGPVQATDPWSFTTGGPKVTWQHPYPGQPLTEQPVFLLVADAPLAPASLGAALRCRVNEQTLLSVTLLEAAEARSRWRAVRGDDRFEADRTVALRCAEPLPALAGVQLVWGRGVTTPQGVGSGSDQLIGPYKVRPVFTARTVCAQIAGTPGCDPRQALRVEFSERVATEALRAVSLRDAQGQPLKLKLEGDPNANTARTLVTEPAQPGALLPEGATLTLQLPPRLHDADGRALTNAAEFPKSVAMATLPPYLGFVETPSVLPYSAARGARWPLAVRRLEAEVPVQVMRIGGEMRDAGAPGDELQRRARASAEALALWHSAGTWPQRGAGPAPVHPVMSQQQRPWASLQTQRVAGTAAPSLTFVPVALAQPGLYLLDAHSARYAQSLATALAARETPPPPGLEPRASLVQVSNLNLSVRLSALGQSLLWVTALDTGAPVEGAEVDWLSCSGRLLAQGRTDAQGLMRVAAAVTRPAESETCPHPSGNGSGHRGLAVVARKGQDLALLSDIGAGYRYGYGSTAPIAGHTVLDRTLFKAGETVHMQHLRRLLTPEGFGMPPQAAGKVEIRFQDGALMTSLPLQWGAQGSADSEWVIPSATKLGRYIAVVSSADGSSHQTSFQVEEFRLPVFDASVSGQAQWANGRQRLPLTLSLSYLAGGAAAGEAVMLQGRYSAGVRPPVEGFSFIDVTLPEWKAPEFAPQPGTLDPQGQRRIDFMPPRLDRPVTLQAEMRFSDPNGEVQTVGRPFALWPADTRLGVRATPNPAVEGASRSVRVQAVVLNDQDRPLSRRPVRIAAQGVRFGWRNGAQTVELIGPSLPVCSGTSDEQGRLECEWNRLPEKIDHDWLISANAADSQGQAIRSNTRLHEFQLRWAPSTEVLALAADQSQPLRAGDAARLVVRAPFWPATLLLTVEREGVLQAGLHRVTQQRSRIDLPLQAGFAPNVRVQARFVRGLADLPAAPAGGAPLELAAEHSLGLKIAPDHYALQVSLRADQAALRPGGGTTVQVNVRHQVGGAPAAHARVTLVAVDEALLSLKDNPSWDLLAAMLRERPIGVQGGALDRLLRRPDRWGPQPAYWPPDDHARMLEAPGAAGVARKAMAAPAAAPPAPAPRPQAAAAGAPGADAVRRDFSSLALWRTEVQLDAQGQARVPVRFNDSLTRWRIVAVAMAGDDRFGSGHTLVQVSQPLQLFSGLPPVLRSGDQLTQRVTLRNTGSVPLTLAFRAQATPQTQADAPPAAPCDATQRPDACTPSRDAVARGLGLQRSLTLTPGQAHDIAWPVAVPEGVKRLDWHLAAASADGRERDALQISQRIVEALPVTVRQATLVQVKGDVRLPVAMPSGAERGKGGVQVSLTDSLARGALQQVRAWMADYPYVCLEQKASKLVVAGDAAGWAGLMRELPKYLDGQGLARYFDEGGLPGSEVLTAYLLDLSAAQRWEIPAESRQRMLAGLERALDAKASAADWQPPATSGSAVARRLALQATLAVHGRIVQADALKERPDDLNVLPTLALGDWARTLLALPGDAASATALRQVASQLRSRFDAQGTQLNWRGDPRDHWWWWMWSQDVAVARTALLAQQWLARDPGWQADLPLLVRGLVARQVQGRWSTTVGNAWGSVALQAFAASAEAGPVSGQTQAVLPGAQPAAAALRWPQPAPVLLQPGAPADLQLQHQGSGAPWAQVSITAAVRLAAPTQAGLQIEKTITPVEQKRPGRWSVGDVARVTLKMRAPSELTWVAVNDPIPSGATILGRGLGRESQLAQQGQRSTGWAWPSFIERASDGYRAYYRFVATGPWSVEYTLRLNNAGRFELPATRVEAMYAPEIFGEAPNAGWAVEEGAAAR